MVNPGAQKACLLTLAVNGTLDQNSVTLVHMLSLYSYYGASFNPYLENYRSCGDIHSTIKCDDRTTDTGTDTWHMTEG